MQPAGRRLAGDLDLGNFTLDDLPNVVLGQSGTVGGQCRGDEDTESERAKHDDPAFRGGVFLFNRLRRNEIGPGGNLRGLRVPAGYAAAGFGVPLTRSPR